MRDETIQDAAADPAIDLHCSHHLAGLVTAWEADPGAEGSPRHLVIPRLARAPLDEEDFDSAAWSSVPATPVASFHPRSGDHRPRVMVRVAATRDALHLRWRVADRHVVSRVVAANGPVCADSCVEAFLAPEPGIGHVNIEVNAGATVHASHVTGLAPFACRLLAPGELACIRRSSTLPPRIDPELPGPLTWELAVGIPFDLLAGILGRPVRPEGSWRANLYKCADRSSHPHWASWSPIGERLAFHQPDRFGFWHFA